MDQRLPYEQIIAVKLESLPVPDMQDAIWARIKTQLDIDMPEDDGDGGGQSGPQSPSGPGLPWILSLVVVAAVTVFLLFNNKNNNVTPQQTNTPVEQTNITPATSGNDPPAAKEKKQMTFTEQADSNNIPMQESAGLVPNAISGEVGQPLFAQGTDSVFTNSSLPPLTQSALPLQSDSVKKKQRGVTGINPGDYRIVPKKDSRDR